MLDVNAKMQKNKNKL